MVDTRHILDILLDEVIIKYEDDELILTLVGRLAEMKK
jgi:hypothetical protein